MLFEDFHTFIFAQVFGLYLIIMAIVLLARSQYYKQILSNIKPYSGSLVVAANFALLIGLFLISVHNIWEWEPGVLVTVLGWVIVVKSILWLGFPEAMLRCSTKVYGGVGYYIILIIAAIVGIILLTKGFYHFQ